MKKEFSTWGGGRWRPRRARRPRVEIKRGVREELLVLIDGQLASLTRPETVSALKTAGFAVIRELCRALESGTTEARAEAAWILGQIGTGAAIPALTRAIEGARWSGEAPVVLRRATEALLRLGPAGIQAFDRATRFFAADDFSRLLLIRHASEQLIKTFPPPPLTRQIIVSWVRALAEYLARIERLDRIGTANKLSLKRVVLEGYGLSLERERLEVPRLIDALRRSLAGARDQANHAG